MKHSWSLFVNECLKAMNNGIETDVIAKDLSKAFDTALHRRLKKNLSSMVYINAQLLVWEENFEKNESLLMEKHLNLLMLYLKSHRALFWDPFFFLSI